jgi:hypothetical protein
MPPSGPPGKKQAPQPSNLRNVVRICSDTSEPLESDDFQYNPSDFFVAETQLANQNSTSRRFATEQHTQQPGMCSSFSLAAVREKDPTHSLKDSFSWGPMNRAATGKARNMSPNGCMAPSKPTGQDIVVIEDEPHFSELYCSEPLILTNILWTQTAPHPL